MDFKVNLELLKKSFMSWEGEDVVSVKPPGAPFNESVRQSLLMDFVGRMYNFSLSLIKKDILR